jgi:hypothetical protein
MILRPGSRGWPWDEPAASRNLSPRPALHAAVAYDYDKLKFLDGRVVLVQPEIFDSQNSVGRRGSLHVLPDETRPEGFRMEIQIEMPEMRDMNGPAAHTEKIPVSSAEIEALLLTEYNGAFTYTQRKPGGPTRTAV